MKGLASADQRPVKPGCSAISRLNRYQQVEYTDTSPKVSSATDFPSLSFSKIRSAPSLWLFSSRS